MRINWPLVSRRRYNALRWQFNQTRLNLEVAHSQVQHLTDHRLDHVKDMAAAKIEIAALKKRIATLNREVKEC